MGEISPIPVSLSFFRRSHRFAFAGMLLFLSIVGGVVTYRIVHWPTVAFEFMNAQPQSSTNVVHATRRSGQANVSAITIRCRGELDGIGAINLGGTFPELIFSNKFDMRITKRDWYFPNCDIALITTNVQTGTVLISYQFHD